MALDLSGISNAVYGVNALAGLLLATPEDKGIAPQDGNSLGETLLFHYNGEQTVSLESDITDHYAESNDHINDQIALRPEVITTQGFIGELSDFLPPELQAIKEIKDKLTSLSAVAPELSITAARTYNLAFQGYQAVQSVKKSVEALITGENQTEQQKQYSLFYGYWKARTLFNVQTPWAIFENMAIKTLTAIQSGETDKITTFEVTFKQMRFAEEIESAEDRRISESFQQGRSYNQAQQGIGGGGAISRPSPSASSFSSVIA